MPEKISAKKKFQLDFDESGFFLIFIDHNNKKIVVEHYLNIKKGNVIGSGKLNKIIEGDNAEAICHTIVENGLVSDLSHACYLGRELQKAEMALMEGKHYEQDKELWDE